MQGNCMSDIGWASRILEARASVNDRDAKPTTVFDCSTSVYEQVVASRKQESILVCPICGEELEVATNWLEIRHIKVHHSPGVYCPNDSRHVAYRFFQPRLTLLRLLILVPALGLGLVGAASYVEARREAVETEGLALQYATEAKRHLARAKHHTGLFDGAKSDNHRLFYYQRIKYHQEMYWKYRLASKNPSVPIPPDPSIPGAVTSNRNSTH